MQKLYNKIILRVRILDMSTIQTPTRGSNIMMMTRPIISRQSTDQKDYNEQGSNITDRARLKDTIYNWSNSGIIKSQREFSPSNDNYNNNNNNNNQFGSLPNLDIKNLPTLTNKINSKVVFNEKRKENLKKYLRKINSFHNFASNNNRADMGGQLNSKNSINNFGFSPDLKAKNLSKNTSILQKEQNKSMVFDQDNIISNKNIILPKTKHQDIPKLILDYLPANKNSKRLEHYSSSTNDKLEQSPTSEMFNFIARKDTELNNDSQHNNTDRGYKTGEEIFGMTNTSTFREKGNDKFSRNSTIKVECQSEPQKSNISPLRSKMLNSAQTNLQDHEIYRQVRMFRPSDLKLNYFDSFKFNVSEDFQKVINTFSHDNETYHKLSKRKSSSIANRSDSNNVFNTMRPSYKKFIKKTFDMQTQNRLQTFEKFAFNCNERDEHKDILPFLKEMRSINKPTGSMSIVDLWPSRLHRDILKQTNLYKQKKIVEKFSFYFHKHNPKKDDLDKDKANTNVIDKDSSLNMNKTKQQKLYKKILQINQANKARPMINLNYMRMNDTQTTRRIKATSKSEDVDRLSEVMRMINTLEVENTKDLKALGPRQRKAQYSHSNTKFNTRKLEGKKEDFVC